MLYKSDALCNIKQNSNHNNMAVGHRYGLKSKGGSNKISPSDRKFQRDFRVQYMFFPLELSSLTIEFY